MIRLGQLFLFWYIFHDLLYRTIQNPAKHLYGMRADAFISLHSSDLTWADMMLVNERILRHFSLLHGFP